LGRYLLVDPVFRRFELPTAPWQSFGPDEMVTAGYGPIAIEDLYETPEGSGLAATPAPWTFRSLVRSGSRRFLPVRRGDDGCGSVAGKVGGDHEHWVG
jgi:hypothetical protein